MIAAAPPARRDLEYAPELAVLHALEALLHASASALHRAHPPLGLAACHLDDSRDARLHQAALVLVITGALRRQIAEYRRVTEHHRRVADTALAGEDDCPF